MISKFANNSNYSTLRIQKTKTKRSKITKSSYGAGLWAPVGIVKEVCEAPVHFQKLWNFPNGV